MNQKTDAQELARAYDIYDPWIAASIDREAWTVTLSSGKTVELYIPLGAAVELEMAGFMITSKM